MNEKPYVGWLPTRMYILETIKKSTEKCRPNFLIAGAARAGTTSLYYWLKQHPDVFMPDEKEPSFFVHDYGISDWEQYLSLFQATNGRKAVGEASTAYLAAPESPELIHRTLGNIKIIIVLRSPIQRALSLHSWMLMEGYEWLRFEQALAAEEGRFRSDSFRFNNPEYFWDYMYFRGGLYYEQVKRYLDTFGSEFVRVYLFDDLANHPDIVFSDICGFLGVSREFFPTFVHTNQSQIPRFIGMQFFFRSVSRRFFKKRPVVSKYLFLLMNLNKKIGYKSEIKPASKRSLQDRYRSDIMNLAELIQKDLSKWLC